MTLAYEPGDSLAHRLDSRTKLAVQVGFALAAFAHTTPRGLLATTAVAGVALAAGSVSPVGAVRDVRYALPFLVAGPVVAGLTLSSPWFALGESVAPALASYRVILVLLVSTVYVRTTPVRDSRAAIQHTIPGRTGRLFGTGVALVFRFLPVVVADLTRARTAMRARLGSQRSVGERIRIVATAGVGRAFGRADRLGLALRARCFAWNPTLPELAFSSPDAPGLALAVGLIGWALV